MSDLKELQRQIEELEKKYSQTENQDEKIKQLIEESKAAVKKLQDKKTNEKTKKAIAGAGKTLASTITMIAAAVNGDWYAFTQNGLDVIAGLAMTVGIFLGPVGEIVGVAIAAVCEVVSSIIALFQPKKESLISQIRRVIVEELKRYEFNEVTKRRVQGWCHVEFTVIQELTFHLQKLNRTGECSYTGFNPQRLDNEIELMGELTFLAEEEFSEMVEEVKTNKKNAAQCLSCIAGYTTICRHYITVLSMHKILCSHYNTKKALQKIEPEQTAALKLFSEATEARFADDIDYLDMKIEKAIGDAKSFLGFLSDEKGMLGPAGWWLGKLRVMKQYRENPSIFASVEKFRKFLGCDPTTYPIDRSTKVLQICNSADRTKLTPVLQWKEFNVDDVKESRHSPYRGISTIFAQLEIRADYFQVINSTRKHMSVFSGLSGPKKSEFQMKVPPYSSVSKYLSTNTIVSYGVITIGEKVENVNEMSDVQVIQFGITNATPIEMSDFLLIQLGIANSTGLGYIVTKPVPTYIIYHLDDMKFGNPDDAKMFHFHGEMHFVQGVTGTTGSNGIVHRIIVEEFDFPKLVEKTKLP